MLFLRVTYYLRRENNLQLVNDIIPMQRTILQPLKEFNDTIDFTEAEPGTKIVAEVVEMPEEEFNKLPEFKV